MFCIFEVTAGEGEGVESTSWRVDMPICMPPENLEGGRPKPQPTKTLEGKATAE